MQRSHRPHTFRGRSGDYYPYFYCINRQKTGSCTLRYVPVPLVEDSTARYFAHLNIDDEHLDNIRDEAQAHLSEHFDDSEQQHERWTRELEQNRDQERALLQAHYQQAVSLELLREEQTRIAKDRRRLTRVLETAQADRERFDAAVTRAINQARNLHASYLAAPDSVRGKLATSFFSAIYLGDDGVEAVDLRPPWTQLLNKDIINRLQAESRLDAVDKLADTPTDAHEKLPEIDVSAYERPHGKLAWEARNPRYREAHGGSNLTLLAEGEGFEPSVTRRPQRLSRPPHSSALATFRGRG